MNREELLKLIDQAEEDGREKLNLEKKGLTELPEEIGKLKNLTEFYLAFNKISKIPNAIAELKNLTGLYLDHNQISEIPSAITELKNLTELYLNNNQISKIPNTISELKKLKTIDLSNNQISEIPETIIQLETLKILEMEGNPIISPPYKIAKKGIDAIHRYFLNQQLSRYKDDDTLKIERSIEFPPEYWTAGTSILSYFSHILSVKYPDQKIKVRIEQEGLLLRMIIDTPTGERELIEQTLNEYGMVITGKLSPENFLHNPFEVMALKNKLEMTQLEFKISEKLLVITSNRDRDRGDIVDLKTQVREIQSIIRKGLQSKDNKSDVPITVNVTVNANDHLSQNNTNQHGQGDNFGGDNVNQDKIGRDKR